MLDLALPKIECERAAENYARFRIEPLEPGYGHTMGNALRRVLLSSIPGAAITRIKIDGVYHEFATVAGTREAAPFQAGAWNCARRRHRRAEQRRNRQSHPLRSNTRRRRLTARPGADRR